jgi:predicted Zn-dependent protease
MAAALEKDEIRRLASTVLEASKADGTEVIVTRRDVALTRFANSEIHQNVAESGINLRVRVIRGSRTGVASTNQVDEGSLRAALARAEETARFMPERPDPPLLAPAAEVAPAAVDMATAGATPEDRAERVGAICRAADAAGVRAFGALSTGVTEYAVANSNGLFVHTPRAVAELRIVTMAEGGSGYADRASARLAEIDAEAAGQEAVEKALRTRGAEAIEPGTYPVVLEEYAVGDILQYLSYIGLSALSVEEGRTFMRPGERITGEAISIWDDGQDPGGVPMPIDFEGVPRRRVDLITRGVATGVVHDLGSAARAGVESTGHGLPAPNPFGAWAVNLFMAGGEAPSSEALAEGIDRGVWVTRLHYVNVFDPRRSSLTGMTRDGTFLIEKGKVTRPIKDMRFTQSVLEAFAGVIAMTRETRVQTGDDYDFASAQRVPAVALRGFNFTSVTR